MPKRPSQPKLQKPLPFAFVLDELADLDPLVRPMFGCHAIYLGSKIVLILREKGDATSNDDGVWVATTADHHESLRRDFPSLRSIELFGPGPSGWQVLPSDSDSFEEDALRICKWVRRADPRIGKIPKTKKPKRSGATSRPARGRPSRPRKG